MKAKRDIPSLQWVADVSDAPCVLLTGSHRALVENITGILEFTGCCLRLNTRQGVLTIEGEYLTVCQARPGSLLAEGRIARVVLPEGGCGDG